MKNLQKLYDIKSQLLIKNRQINASEYFHLVEQIRSRPNQYIIPQKKIIIKRPIYEPFKDPFVIRENKRNKLRIYNIIDARSSPKLNYEYLEVRDIMRHSKEKQREIAERAISLENSQFQERVFNQRPRIEEYKNFKTINNNDSDNSRDKDYESNYKKYTKKIKKLILPDIYGNKNKKSQKVLKTDININRDSLNEQLMEKGKKMEDHNYAEISHQKQGHIQG